jgi:sugar lactone lactonase YvrE
MELTAEPVLQAQALLGEGAIWDHDKQLLHWVDINRNRIHTFDPLTNANTWLDVGERVGTVVKRSAAKGGGFIVGLPRKFAHVDGDGQISILAELMEGQSNRSNDGKCDPSGRFWCGSMTFDFAPGASHLYMMDTDHQVHHKLDNITTSNGIVWTKDGKTMYYIDTGNNQLDAFDFDIATGNIKNRRVAVSNTWGGYFDGMTIDVDDNVYIAIWGGGKVLKINPSTGDLIATIKVPGAKNVTSCAFGGPDFHDLYITTSGEEADPKQEPNAGALFKVRLEDAQGLPAYEFLG